MFLQNSLISISGRFLGAILSLSLGILIARILGPENLGQYQIFVTTQTILLTLFSFGLGNASLYFIKGENEKTQELISNILKIIFPVGIILTFLFGISIFVFEYYFGRVSLIYLFFFLLGTLSLFVTHFLKPMLYLENKIKKIMILNLVPLIIVLIGTVVLFYFKILNVDGILFFWGIGNTIVMLLLINHFLDKINFNVTFKLQKIKKIFFYGIKLSATNLLFVLNSSVIILLLKYFLEDGFTFVGIYSRAVAISSVLMMVPNSIGPLLFSKWAGTKKNQLNKQVEQTQRILIFLSIMLFLFILLGSDLIIQLLYGNKYLSASQPLVILSFSLVFYTITEVLNNLIASKGLAIITLKVFCISFLIILLNAYLLIPKYNINGAAVSILLGSLFNSISLLYFAVKNLGINFRNSLIINNQDFQFILNNLKSIF